MKPTLTIEALQDEASKFAEMETTYDEPTLYGVTDGKAVGTYLEHKFTAYLAATYEYEQGNSASGIDLPGLGVDIKVTSFKQPQSSCPFKSASQKIFGLGYNLLIFVYEKIDDEKNKSGRLNMQHTIFVEKERTADFQTTKGLLDILEQEGNKDDVIAFINERNLPVDEIGAEQLADRIIETPPNQGYLTISNALQWRLQYGRVIQKAGEVCGISRVRSKVAKKSIDKWQFGDFQTPIDLARKVVEVLKRNHAINPDVIIEPTCGKGAFVRASCEGFTNATILGFEINPGYVQEANLSLKDISTANRATISEADFFDTDWNKTLSELQGNILIIGNPPWVTSSELGLINSKNLPEKSNFQNRKGIEAITGSGNFDISEWMLLKHVEWLANREGAIAFLCKYAVARKVMRQVRQSVEHRFFGHIYPIDAKLHFEASVEACLFILTTDPGNADCEVYESLDSVMPSHIIGERDGYIVSDVNNYEKWRKLRGQDPRFIWRSGVKHDCAKIMELEPLASGYKNGLGETVKCEDKYIYPLLKSSDVGNGRVNAYRRVVLITQKSVGEETLQIKKFAPKTWEYLIDHREYLDKRKSTIYKNKPDFSIFGVGEYSFKEWKIAISGLYKKLRFNLIGPLDGKTVVFDDTVNFLSFDTKEEAEFVYHLITSAPALEFLESMIFWDEKRPITTQVLRKISIKEIARELGEVEQYQQWAENQRTPHTGQLELAIAEQKTKYHAATSS